MITFHCHRFENSPTWRVRSAYLHPLGRRVARLYPQALVSLFVVYYVSLGYGGGIRPRLHTNHIENIVSIVTVHQYLDCFLRSRCRGNPFAEQLSSHTPGIVDVFTGRYQATHVPSRDHCIATSIQSTIFYSLTALGAFRLNT
jgi:hypothetical protein